MHKIQIAFGIPVGDTPVPVRVILDDRELQGVSSVEIALDNAGVTQVILTMVATVPGAQVPPRTKHEGTP